jgi:chromosome segregation ATPase
MSEQAEKKEVTVETLKESLADLRYVVSEFQESIGTYLSAVEELWTDVKSNLASVEARLVGLEVQLSAVPVDAEWPQEKLTQMLQDLSEIAEEIVKMRRRFRTFTQGYQERIN